MLSLSINNVLIPLPSGISLPLVLKNPLFCLDGDFPGSFVFNFSLPATDQLRAAVGHPHRVQKASRATDEFDYVLTLGVLRYEGKCTVTEADRDTYEVSLNVDNGDFYAAIKSKSLKDLDLDGDRNIALELSAAKLSAPLAITQSRTIYFEYEVPVVDTIFIDITSSLTENGLQFTATRATTISVNTKFNFVIDGTIFYGNLIIKKNGSEVSNTAIDTVTPVDTTVDVAVVSGDVITVQLILKSVLGEDIYYLVWCTLQSFVVEYIAENSFDIAAVSDQDISDFVVFPIENEKILDNFPDDAFLIDNESIKVIYSTYFKVQNYWKNGRFPLILVGEKEGVSYQVANLFTPFVYLKYLFTKIASEAGYTLIDTPFDYETTGAHPVKCFKNAVLFNSYAENTYIIDDSVLVPVKTTINLVDHVPDMDQGEFFKQVCLLTGYMPVVNNQQKTITFIHLPEAHDDPEPLPGTVIANPVITVKPEYKGIKFELKNPGADSFVSERIQQIHDKLVYKGSVTQLSLLPASGNTVNDMYLVSGLNEYYVWQYNPDTYALNWVYYTRNLQMTEEEGDDSKLQVSPELHPVIMSKRLDETLSAPAGGRTWKIPVTKQAGILEGFPIGHDTEWGFQFLIYCGLKGDSNDEIYPYATSEVYDYIGIDQLVHDMDARGIYDNHWKVWLEWLAYEAKPVKFYARLTPAQLRSLNIHKPQRLPDGSTVMIKELSVNLKIDGLSVAEIEAYTV